LSHRVDFFCGDVSQKLPSIIKAHPETFGKGIDLLFIDSDHSHDFAYWYLSIIFPLVKQGGLIHIHDIQIDPDVWPEKKASFPFSFPPPSTEEIAVQEYLNQSRDRYDWISLRACIEDKEYLKSIQPYGGGEIAIPADGSTLHWVDQLLGYQRSPTLWLYKKS
jgi:predicted O-methyltransferase YrrM